MGWNRATNYKKTKDRTSWQMDQNALSKLTEQELLLLPMEIQEQTRKECDSMLLSAQREAGDVRQQAQRAAETTREEAQRDAADIRKKALEDAREIRREAEEIREQMQKELTDLLTEAKEESEKIRKKATQEAAELRKTAMQAAKAICQNAQREAKEIYLAAQVEMHQMIDGINQAQNSFMKSYKEVHRILNAIPDKLMQLDAEEEAVEELTVPTDQELVKHMEDIFGGEDPIW